MVDQLHIQAVGVQNIRALVTVLLDSTSSYGRWRDQVLLALRRRPPALVLPGRRAGPHRGRAGRRPPTAD